MSKTRRLIYDWDDSDPPQPGEVIHPSWPGGHAWYRVIGAEPVETRDTTINRWRVTVERCDPGSRPTGGGRLIGSLPHDYAWRPWCHNCRRRVPLADCFEVALMIGEPRRVKGVYHPYRGNPDVPCGPVDARLPVQPR